jgi:hypothetical protein
MTVVTVRSGPNKCWTWGTGIWPYERTGPCGPAVKMPRLLLMTFLIISNAPTKALFFGPSALALKGPAGPVGVT